MEERLDKSYKIAMVGNELLKVGFKLAGVNDSYIAKDSARSESIMKDLLGRGDIGIIIMSSQVKKQIHDRRLVEQIESSILPLVIEVPEPGEGVAEEDTLRNLIIRAIGIDITKMNMKKSNA